MENKHPEYVKEIAQGCYQCFKCNRFTERPDTDCPHEWPEYPTQQVAA